MGRPNNIVASLEYLHLIGWKYHESQQAPKKRGSAEFSLKDVVEELNSEGGVDENGEKHQIRYGVICEDELVEDSDKNPNKD